MACRTGIRCAVGAALVLLAPLPGRGQSGDWRTDYVAARREAAEKNRPIVLDFGTERCVWCKKLDALTFRDPAVVKLLRERFVAIRIDANKQPALAQALAVHSYPTLVFAAPDGKVLGKHEGFVEPPRFVQQLQKALASVESTGAAPPAVAAASDDAEALRQACQHAAEIFAELHLALADVYLRQGKTADAAVCLRKAVQSGTMGESGRLASLRLRELEARLATASPASQPGMGN